MKMKKDLKTKIIDHFKEKKQAYIIGTSFVLWFLLLVFLAVVVRKYNSVAISIGGFDIAWYAIFILSGISMGTILGYREAKLLNINRDHLIDGVLIGVVLSIIGARLYYVAFNPVGGFKEIIDIRTGGLAIHGVIISMILFVPIYTRIRKMNVWGLIDMLAIAFLIGQVIGRWGNFFNQEAHGGPISEGTLNFLNYIIPNFIMKNMNIGGTYYHPTFLYEGLWNFAGLVFLLIIRRKRVLKLGDMFGLYLIWYGVGRGLLIEPFRTDPLLFINTADPENFFLNMLNRVNVVLSLTLFTIGGTLFIVLKNKLIPNMPYYYDVVLENVKKISAEEQKEKKEKEKLNKKKQIKKKNNQRKK